MKYRRMIVYIEPEDHQKLKSKLSLEDKTVSAWIRDQVQAYINEDQD